MTFEQILESQGTLVYTNVGTSMMPLLRQRRDLLVLVRPEGRLRLWDVPLFRRPNETGKYILHRILWVGKHGYWICGDNQWRPEWVRDEQIIAVLNMVRRDGKMLVVRSTSLHPRVSLAYRLYVFVWCFFFPIRAAILLARHVVQKLTHAA